MFNTLAFSHSYIHNLIINKDYTTILTIFFSFSLSFSSLFFFNGKYRDIGSSKGRRRRVVVAAAAARDDDAK